MVFFSRKRKEALERKKRILAKAERRRLLGRLRNATEEAEKSYQRALLELAKMREEGSEDTSAFKLKMAFAARHKKLWNQLQLYYTFLRAATEFSEITAQGIDSAVQLGNSLESVGQLNLHLKTEELKDLIEQMQLSLKEGMQIMDSVTESITDDLNLDELELDSRLDKLLEGADEKVLNQVQVDLEEAAKRLKDDG